MFETLFKRPTAVARHREGPWADARERFLEECAQQGYSRSMLVLYGAGLRISEALALTIGDVDLPDAILRIGPTKFYKTRIVPMGKDLTRIVAEYAARRNQTHCVAAEAPFFCFDDGTPLSKAAAQSAFRRLRSHAGVRRAGDARRQPRLHDLRHNSGSRIIPGAASRSAAPSSVVVG